MHAGETCKPEQLRWAPWNKWGDEKGGKPNAAKVTFHEKLDGGECGQSYDEDGNNAEI